MTGASGFIGTAVTDELVGAGHEVAGLARSDAPAQALVAQGVDVVRRWLDDLAVLRRAAADSDAVIHLAFEHCASSFERAAHTDVQAIRALSEALAGSDRPLVITSDTLVLPAGRLGRESDQPDLASPAGPRAASETKGLSLASGGVRSIVVRLAPSVHDQTKRGFLGRLVDIARDKGVSGYVGGATNRWPAVHRLDAASLFRLAVEKAPPGTVLHGVAEQGVTLRSIAEVIGTHLSAILGGRPVPAARPSRGR